MTRTRIAKTTTTAPNGTRVTKTKLVAAPELEWVCQAEQVRQLKAMPEYAATVDDVLSGKGKFTIAADQNAGRRGKQASVQAKSSGLAPGEHDVRVYIIGGFLGLIENKVGKSPLQDSQKVRHPLLAALGFTRQAIIRATTPEDMARQGVALVTDWLAECQRSDRPPRGSTAMQATDAANDNETPPVGLKMGKGKL